MMIKKYTSRQSVRNPQDSDSVEGRLYEVGLGLLLIAPILLVLSRHLHAKFPILRMPCLLHTLTGYYCPGCGGTRAVHALLHLQLLRSFCYHPLVPYAAAVYLWFMVSHTIDKLSRHHLHIGMKWNAGWLWAALVILAINVLVKDGALLLFHVDLLQLPKMLS